MYRRVRSPRKGAPKDGMRKRPDCAGQSPRENIMFRNACRRGLPKLAKMWDKIPYDSAGRMPDHGGIMIRISLLTIAFALAASAGASALQFPAQPPPVNGPAGMQGNEQERGACS